MAKSKTTTERIFESLKNRKPIAVLIVIATVLIAIGQLSGSLNSLVSLWNRTFSTSTDPRVLKYKDQTITLSGGNGTSLEQAIVINGALTHEAGYAAINYWVERFYPDYKMTKQALLASQNRKAPYYEVLFIESTRTGYKRELYFDITALLGTPSENSATNEELEKMVLKSQKRFAEEGKKTLVIPIP